MKVHAILNRDGGTLKTTDLAVLSRLIEDEFRLHGHEIEVEVVAGQDVVGAIGGAGQREDIDVLLVGGGDGTVSCAAATLMDRRTALAILPAGTMNLFARSLQIPLALQEAVSALAGGRVTAVDIATVNGKPFVHQFSVGLHARMVRARESLDYGSRIGKMWASTRAIVTTLRSLPLVHMEIEIDGKRQRIQSPAIAVSNNLYGEGHLPFTDEPQAGQLGIYICRTDNIAAVSKLALDILRGAWRGNPALAILTARTIKIDATLSKASGRAVRDGELVDLEPSSEVKIHPRALRVLVPQDATLSD